MSLASDIPRGLGDLPQPLRKLIRGVLVPTWLMLVSPGLNPARSTSNPWVRPGSRVSNEGNIEYVIKRLKVY